VVRGIPFEQQRVNEGATYSELKLEYDSASVAVRRSHCPELSDSEEELPMDVDGLDSESSGSDSATEPEVCSILGCGRQQRYLKNFVRSAGQVGHATTIRCVCSMHYMRLHRKFAQEGLICLWTASELRVDRGRSCNVVGEHVSEDACDEGTGSFHGVSAAAAATPDPVCTVIGCQRVHEQPRGFTFNNGADRPEQRIHWTGLCRLHYQRIIRLRRKKPRSTRMQMLQALWTADEMENNAGCVCVIHS